MHGIGMYGRGCGSSKAPLGHAGAAPGRAPTPPGQRSDAPRLGGAGGAAGGWPRGLHGTMAARHVGADFANRFSQLRVTVGDFEFSGDSMRFR